MDHALAAAPRLQLDPKRIAATSGAIAVHVAVLMMLMMPAAQPSPAQTREVITDVTFETKRPPPTPLLPLIKLPPKPQPPTAQPQHIVPVVEPPPVNLNQEASVVDYVATEVPEVPATSFDTGPATSMFQQLATIAAPPPVYPRMAVTRGIQGTVMLRIHVDAGGNPIEVSIENSSGSVILDQAALKVVKARWRFVPAQRDGQATDAWALVPVEFVLD